MVYVIIAIIFLLLVFIILALRRVSIPRRVSNEGIENEEVVEAYNRINRWPQFRLLRKVIINEIKRYQPAGTIVDVGCGPGYLIENLASSFPNLKIIGVDIAEEMLAKAKNNLYSPSMGRNIEFRLGDTKELPFEDGSIDFLISTLSLHHWSEPDKAITEIYRVLKQGGQFLVFDLRRDAFRLIYWVLRFARLFVLPDALKQINEPTASFLAAYMENEVKDIIVSTPFKHYDVKPGLIWLFIWGKKEEIE